MYRSFCNKHALPCPAQVLCEYTQVVYLDQHIQKACDCDGLILPMPMVLKILR